MAEEEKGMTFEDIKLMIVGDKDKVTLLNLFQSIINENTRLKLEVEELKKAKPTESSS
jgi:regulator of replication initiation timing